MKIDKTSITLHPQYGLNASMSACILCGDPTGEILFLGNSIAGEAPRLLISAIEPCEECRENYLGVGVGTLLVESTDGMVTGRSMVMKDSAFAGMFDIPIPENKIVLLEPTVYTTLVDNIEKSKGGAANESSKN